jgi:3-deoxy-D-manno-octulosonate 8-phosphate phosphatase (KDO 8-P phosphatase)
MMDVPYGFIDPRKQRVTKEIERLASKIKLLILDVDGVLTDGTVFWVEGTGWSRSFHVRDGYGMKLLMKAGIEIAFISGGDSASVRERAKFLGIQHVHLGDENKIVAFDKVLAETKLKAEQCAFMGDDLFDIPVLRKVGFSATVPGAVPEVKDIVHYITQTAGGMGAAREICDLILKSKA